MNGGCSSKSGAICNGTSVLNDGIIPALSGVSDDRQSQWAAQLFTMRRAANDAVVVSLEVEMVNHDRVEFSVFNCPEMRIYAPRVNIYSGIFFPLDNLDSMMVGDGELSEVSCSHLIKFCVELRGASSVPAYDLEFPFQVNSSFIFIGEVTFLNGGIEPCDEPELITLPEG